MSKARTIRLVRPLTPDEPGVLCIVDKGKSTFYAFREIPCEIGGRAFAVHRLGLGTLYCVRVGAPEECSCECLGFLSKGHCKHIQGLLALTGHGMV
jgi:hypothetical protein